MELAAPEHPRWLLASKYPYESSNFVQEALIKRVEVELISHVQIPPGPVLVGTLLVLLETSSSRSVYGPSPHILAGLPLNTTTLYNRFE